MRLSRLLSELRRNILHDRSDQIAGNASDQMWSDEDLVEYINQAQDRFCRETELLREFQNPEVCQIQTIVGQNTYPLHPAVIGVISARNTGDNTDLARTGHSNLQTYFVPDTYWFNPTNLSALQPGKPLAFATDEGFTAATDGSGGVMNLRVYPDTGPGYASIINLRVVRRPLRRLHLDDLNGVPEVPEAYQLDMLDWAAYLAIRSPDLDIAGVDQLVRMRDFRATFDDTCKRVRQQLMRKAFAPAVFGFGRNGFSYQGDYNP